jgi:thermitase
MRPNYSKRKIRWGKMLFSASLALLFLIYPLSPVFAQDEPPPAEPPEVVVVEETESPVAAEVESTPEDESTPEEVVDTEEEVAAAATESEPEAETSPETVETIGEETAAATESAPEAEPSPETVVATGEETAAATESASEPVEIPESEPTAEPAVPLEVTPEPIIKPDPGSDADSALESASPTETVLEGTTSILVKYDAGVSQEELFQTLMQYGAVVSSDLSKINFVVLDVPQSQYESTMQSLAVTAGVLLADSNGDVFLMDTIPNDPSFGTQYGLTAINAPQGWDTSTGSALVTIAIVDSGVDLTHPDLAGRFVAGYDFVNNDADPTDDYGHGTHVAGIAAAVTDNNTGVAGVDWDAQIMPVKVLDSAGFGSFNNAALGIIWAVDHGAQVINLSLGASTNSPVLRSAIEYAYSQNVVVVAAAGNSNTNVFYPAAYPQAIAVAASDELNNRAGFSNYGPEVDVAAPGVNIYSTTMGGGYDYLSGTSMSTAFVSGEAAILIGIRSDLTPDEVADIIKSSALDIGAPGFDNQTGYGLIQLDSAVVLLLQTPVAEPPSTVEEPPLQKERSREKARPALKESLPPSTSNGSPSNAPTLPSTTADEPEVVAQSDLSTPTPTPTQPPLLESSVNPDVSNTDFSCIVGLLIGTIGIFIFLWSRRKRTAQK